MRTPTKAQTRFLGWWCLPSRRGLATTTGTMWPVDRRICDRLVDDGVLARCDLVRGGRPHAAVRLTSAGRHIVSRLWPLGPINRAGEVVR